MINVEVLESFPPGSNPFHHDLYRMGMRLGTNVVAMFEKFDHQEQAYLIIVNTATGERVRLNFTEDRSGQVA